MRFNKRFQQTFLVRLGVLLVFVFFGGSSGQADWQKGQQAYDEGKLEEALKEFQSSSSSRNRHDVAHYYNLGNVYYRMGQFGVAAAYYEKAKQLDPFDADIRHNLTVVQNALQKTLGPQTSIESLDSASTWWENLADQLPLDILQAFLSVFAALTALFWIKPYFKTRQLKPLLSKPTAWLSTGSFLVMAGLGIVEASVKSRPAAICTQRQIIRSGPGTQFLELGWVGAGVRVRLLGPETNQWRQIRHAPGAVGWIQKDTLLLP